MWDYGESVVVLHDSTHSDDERMGQILDFCFHPSALGLFLGEETEYSARIRTRFLSECMNESIETVLRTVFSTIWLPEDLESAARIVNDLATQFEKQPTSSEYGSGSESMRGFMQCLIMLCPKQIAYRTAWLVPSTTQWVQHVRERSDTKYSNFILVAIYFSMRLDEPCPRIPRFRSNSESCVLQ